MTKIRIIADVHGKIDKYLTLINDSEYSIQLGDFSYNYHFLHWVDNKKHIALYGNHCHHIDRLNWPHILNNGYGLHNHGGLDFFYVCGAFSIDKELRQKYYYSGKWPQTWWPEEELSYDQLENAIALYEEVKPDIVLTHDAPRSIGKLIGNPDILKEFGFNPDKFITRTSEALDIMFGIHQPKLFVHGHFHKNHITKVGKTTFVGLGELNYIDLNDIDAFLKNPKIY